MPFNNLAEQMNLAIKKAKMVYLYGGTVLNVLLHSDKHGRTL